MMRARPAPQTAEQAQECIAEIFRVYKSKKARQNRVGGFLRLNSTGYSNWSPEALAVWEQASAELHA